MSNTDYSELAGMMGVDKQNVSRTFNMIRMSGSVERETLEDGSEKRLPAKYTLFDLKGAKQGEMPTMTDLGSEVSLIPLKPRYMLEQRDNDGKTLMYSTEYNNFNDTVILTDKTNDKDIKKYRGAVKDLRKQFVNAEGKSTLKVVCRLYSLYNGEVVRLLVKGSAIWEGPDAPTKENSITEYLQTFPSSEPAFLFEMKAGSVYRPKKSNKVEYNRSVFSRGNRIDLQTEGSVIESLKDIFDYCNKQDEFVKTTDLATAPIEQADAVAATVPGTSADEVDADLGF